MMPDDLDLMQLASSGQKLARVDDVDYLAVHVVLAWPATGAPSVYCTYTEWPGTHAARLAAKEHEIAELAAGLERYAAEAVEQAQRAEAALARVAELEQRLAERPKPQPSDPGPCPDCGKHDWHTARALQMHRQRAHQGMQAGPRRASIELVGDDPTWRCAEPHCAGAFTRSLSNPAYCTQHAKLHSLNGQEIAEVAI